MTKSSLKFNMIYNGSKTFAFCLIDHSFRCEQYMILQQGTELVHTANFNKLLVFKQLAVKFCTF